MKVFTELARIRDIPQTAIALGNFDGVHLGHVELIRRMVTYARGHGLAPAVFTFSNHPCNVIAGETVIRSLATERDKEAILRSLGVAYLFSLKFDEGFHSMPPEGFIDDLLLGAFAARAVFCGFNFRFGAEAAGSAELLREAGAVKGFELIVMEPYRIGDALVSSTAIRRFVDEGDLDSAAKFLGRPFSISGEIARGNGIGRGLGFPTANITLPEGVVVPPYGVYVTESELAGRGGLRSVTNVGVRPTIGDERLLAETHIFEEPDLDLYGSGIRVDFLSLLRAERKFADVEALKAQVELDKLSALAYRRTRVVEE
jgi:riboflavin kinase/FMN adenylyltransferase